MSFCLLHPVLSGHSLYSLHLNLAILTMGTIAITSLMEICFNLLPDTKFLDVSESLEKAVVTMKYFKHPG